MGEEEKQEVNYGYGKELPYQNSLEMGNKRLFLETNSSS